MTKLYLFIIKLIKMITALKNKLIEADHPVGRKPVNNWKLPPTNFAYGWKDKDDEFHAGASKINFNFK